MLKIFAGILLICSTFSWLYAGEEPKKTDAQLREEYMKKDLATLKDLGEPRLSRSGESCLILLGDTQTYTPKMQLAYMCFPRAAAIAERAWSPESEKNYSRFIEKLQNHFSIYEYSKWDGVCQDERIFYLE